MQTQAIVMAPILQLPSLQEASESWVDSVDIVTTPSPWAHNYHPDFMLPAALSLADKLEAKVVQDGPTDVTEMTSSWGLEGTLAHPIDIGLDFMPVPYTYLSPQCFRLQNGLAQMRLLVEEPGSQRNHWYNVDGVQVQNGQDWDIRCEPKLDVDGNFRSERYGSFASTQGCDETASHSESFSDSESTRSVDQSQHSLGQCKPCAWFWKKQGCRNGSSCNYCHLCPQGELRSRKKARLFALKSAEKHA